MTAWRAGDNRLSHPLYAWLGPAEPDLTDEQLVRLLAESERIEARYPDEDDQYRRDAALSAAVQYILGETTIDEAGRARSAAKIAELEASAASQQIAAMCCDDGMGEIEAARRAGIDRMTVRKARGKPRP